MRKLAAILVALALPSSMLAAPFSHVHDPGVADEHVAEHHSGGLELHFHLAGIDTGARTRTREVNESAQSLNLYKANLALEGSLAGDHLVQYAAESPDVGTGVYFDTLGMFGRHVSDCSHRRIGLG